MLVEIKSCIVCSIMYMGPISHSLAELLLTTKPPSFLHKRATIYWNLLVVSGPVLYFRSLFIHSVMYLLANSTICLCTLNCTFAHLITHNYIFIVFSGCHNLARFEWNQRWLTQTGITAFTCRRIYRMVCFSV